MNIEHVFTYNEYSTIWETIFNDTKGGPGLWNVRRTLLRMVLNPQPSLRAKFFKERSQLLKLNHTIGLQLRMGGQLANKKEKYEGVPLDRIDQVIDQVSQVIQAKNWTGQAQLFISSDSSSVIEIIKNKTHNLFPVVSSQLFMKGHTAMTRSINIKQSVLIDMYYMSMADHVIVTWPSSLGRLMCYMNDHPCDAVLNWWSFDKNKQIH